MMTRHRLTIYLTEDDFGKLNEVAKYNYRSVHEQASWIIAQYAKGNLVMQIPDPPERLDNHLEQKRRAKRTK